MLKPDLGFVKDIISSGGKSLKKCYQCATCSVVCNITSDENPFPRKEMLWAQWGLKENFIGNPSVWLCYQCNDCSNYCPRDAKPGEVLGAIRKQTIKHYSTPSFMTDFVNNWKFIPILFLLPTILFLIMLWSIGNLKIPDGEIVFSKFFPVYLIDIMFGFALFFGLTIGTLGIRKFWKDLLQNQDIIKNNFKKTLFETVKEILSHDKFKKCDKSKNRFTTHLLVFYGFISAGIATTLALIYLYILKIESPYPIIGSVKVFGNIGAILLFTGITFMIIYKIKNAKKLGFGSYFDWLLIFTIAIITITGILSEVIRLLNISTLAYTIYFIHLVFVFSLFIYLPYSKLAHIFYRITALYYAKSSNGNNNQKIKKVLN